MAELRKAILGQVSGALGDIVFREREGLNYLATRPTSFIPGNDPASVARRQRFALTAKTSVSINRVPELKSLWEGVLSNGISPFNYIFKTNYHFVTSSTITDLLKIVPDNGFGIIVTDSNVDRVRVRVTIDSIGTNAGIVIADEPNIMMASIVFLSSPVDESVGAYSLISVVSPPQATNLGQELTFDADLINQQQLIFDKYQSTKTFIAVFTLDSAESPVHYSSTVLLT